MAMQSPSSIATTPSSAERILIMAFTLICPLTRPAPQLPIELCHEIRAAGYFAFGLHALLTSMTDRRRPALRHASL
jgi:hypothetical protein